jgi:hypothetical protein
MPTHQYSLTLIHREANGSVIDQRSADGYINATALCKAGSARWSDYYSNDRTKAFFDVVAAKTGIPVLALTQKVTEAGRHSIWVHPKVAIHLGQWISPEFAYQVSEWVQDWISGKGAPKAPPSALPTHLARYLANDGKVPPGYFSVLQETGLNLFGPLHNVGFEIPSGWVPDISVGLGFCKWLRKVRGINTDELLTYIHTYGDHRKPAPAKLYPDELLADFRRWFRTTWLPENGVKYFKAKDPNSLAFLDKLPALAGPSHRVALSK